ncbi:efflux RND transporter periplasmic adaptor subunit [Actimicrobium sp. CCC2.4]|uniref:HlyD family efflux transporter periplasmic adaptor subunit n=1 Tax=Actimicrobium sp. CCC2.4 TaxID=3048606 RepID=UPI002AC9D7D1|nr:HlyD family efflux transporter periplasmic adaptor subunit [Actimicrobium sp. CCC2.4]MEB0135169.1 efflux RND transporter periplasmic adaptor subunit [Actimicrobium sp. CCC2.4]WPX30967.1 efflux RND transporter periplasmic adaptor subunit [Actimicrobium sp. CCC2.4]
MSESADLAGTPQSLWQSFAAPIDTRQFGSAWLALQCAMIEGATGAVMVLGPPDTGPFLPVAFWPPQQAPGSLLTEVAGLALESRQPTLLADATQAALAYPVILEGHLHGLVAVQTQLRSDAGMQDLTRQLQWGLQGIEAALLRQQSGHEQTTRERLMTTLDLVASAMTEQKFTPAAHALVTDLAIRFDCDRVSVGFRRTDHTGVDAVSHSAQIGKRMNLIRAIGSAIDEAIDQQSLLQLPAPAAQLLVTRDHAALARQHGSDNVLTIPFVVGATGNLVVGGFTFERSGARPFTPTEIELCQAVVALCSRILEEKRLNDRLLVARIKDLGRDQLIKFTGPRFYGRKLAAGLLMLAVLFFSIASSTYTVGANAALEGAIRRVLVAPFDGYVATASQRAGDVIKAGTVLATLDQRDLQLEYLRWASQAEQYSKQYQEAMAKADRVQLNISLAQVQQARAQMDLLAEQLARASITAPLDGIVVSGDLSQALGSAVKRGQTLFEVAPLNAYRVILEVDESDITGIREGLRGELMLTALPGQVFPLVISHLTPVTSSREGRSFFRVEANVEQVSDKLRPGMEGIGKIAIGQRKLIWQWTHKLVDWLRLSVWSWI